MTGSASIGSILILVGIVSVITISITMIIKYFKNKK